jgi:glycosyltransferase involved in cell wall biosynthesis
MSINAQPLVTVVTPLYNGEKYLAECIESVLNQTYLHWNYVIVNNCSTDGSLAIAASYAAKDRRIRIHNNEKLVGRNANHNIAFRQISPESKYCKVVHADDWLFPDCIARMVNVAEAHPSVVIVGAYVLSGTQISCDGLAYPSTFLSGTEICRRVLLDKLHIFGCPTSLLIRSDVIRQHEAFYNETNEHADKEVCLDVLQNADFGFVHEVLTFQRLHEEAATAFSDRVNTYLPGNLMILKKYGPVYLNDEEYETCLQDHMESYYSFLADILIYRRDSEIIEYHKRALSRYGISLQPRQAIDKRRFRDARYPRQSQKNPRKAYAEIQKKGGQWLTRRRETRFGNDQTVKPLKGRRACLSRFVWRWSALGWLRGVHICLRLWLRTSWKSSRLSILCVSERRNLLAGTVFLHT